MLIPKVANESIKYAFMQILGIPVNMHPSYAFETCDKYWAAASPYWVFSFVRNPFDRLVSCWHQKTQGSKFHRAFGEFGIYPKIPFPEFVEIVCRIPDEKSDQHWRSQAYELLIAERLIPDFIGRFETIVRGWKMVQKKIPELPDLPHKNKSDHRHHQEYYTLDLKERVAKRYQQDLEVFNYDF